MAKIAPSPDELNRHLADCIGFLEASSHSFDRGFFGEAKRLATTVRVLFHDTKNSRSLLDQMGRKETMTLPSTANEYDERFRPPHTGLTMFRLSAPGGVSYYAPLGDGPAQRCSRPSVPFEDWWKETVIVDGKDSKFSRRALVLHIADTDGGAHVDPNIDQNYADLTRNNSVGWIGVNGAGAKAVDGVELHSIRQIAYEVLKALGAIGAKAA
jgi:hypothetical protein